MKVTAISAACILALGGGVLSLALGRADADKSPAPAGVQQVDDLRLAEPAPGRSLTVEGVVAEVQPYRGLVGLIDVAEAEKCGLSPCDGCTRFMLPVEWQGDLPEPGDTVVVRGKIERGADGLVLAGGRADR
jgi:hypothetical protein